MMATNPFLLLGLILVAAVFLGDAAERVGVPWITGCILGGVLLGPDAVGVLTPGVQSAFGPFLQASLALIAFDIGSRLTGAKLRSIGGGIGFLTLLQLLAPLFAVLAVIAIGGFSWSTAVIVAAVAPATAPTTTYAIVRRRNASGPFVDRALAILAINDGVTMLLFSVVSAATVAWLAAPNSGHEAWTALRLAAMREGLSLLVGALLGCAYLLVHALVADGRPGWQNRLRATLYALLLLSVGAAIAFGLSHLLTPLVLGVVLANGASGSEASEVKAAIEDIEEPLYMVFFVLAGARLPVADLGQGTLALAGFAYVLARLCGKYAAIYLGALALRLDAGARRYLGLCFPSQGGAAMGLVLACAGSPAVRALPAGASRMVETAVTIVLVGVLLSQMFGPMIIDIAIRRGAQETPRA
jgi:Kef-type K+ transport system membrane component KefB